MAIRVNPELVDEIEQYGADDVSKCYHCGNCSAVCPHSKEPFVFPRRSMRTLQMGLEAKLKESLEPWLCYYCGQCSEQCPRDAEPGETMMSLRRWLTSRYDITGISRLFYRSWRAELVAILLCALVVGGGLVAFGQAQGDLRIYDGAGAFLPSSAIHVFDWAMAGVLTFLLLANAARMWWFTVGRRADVRVPWYHYLKAVYLLPLHFFTQKRYAQCGKRTAWAVHLVLLLSYVTLFTLIMFFLHEMQSGPAINWDVHVFGYLASAGLIGAVIFAMHSRLRKSGPQYRHSHESDWLFLILLLYVAVSGVAQHVLHRTGFDVAANVTYVLHLMGVVPMLVLEVPFGKWSHMAYRPLAQFFADLVEEALLEKRKQLLPATRPQPVRTGG